MELSFLIPALDAGRTIEAVVTGLQEETRKLGGEPKIWVVDDGSRDDTATLAEAAGAIVVRHPKNLGKGAALSTGLALAQASGVQQLVTVDADGQHPADEAVILARHPAPARALVLGVRDLAGAQAPRANRISNGISNAFLSLFAWQRLADTQCGLRRYPVAATLECGARDSGYAFEAEVLLRAARAGWHIEQVPIRVYYPPPGESMSHFHAVRDPVRIVLRVLKTLADIR